MNRTRNLLFAATVVALGATFGVEQSTLNAATKTRAAQAPKFVVDLYWPKPLPSHTLLGSANGVAVDSHDHVFVLNNPNSFTARTEIGAATNPPTGNCCEPTSPVLEFDAAGALVAHWGGPGQGYDWPATPSGIAVDDAGNVWIGGSGVGDGQILKFSHDGKFLMQSGKPGKAVAAATAETGGYAPGTLGGPPAAAAGRGGRGGGAGTNPVAQPMGDSNNMDEFGAPARFSFDTKANEVFVADGYRNRRVAVLDMTSGKIKRMWGAYGKKPDDTDRSAYSAGSPAAQHFRDVTCAVLAKDGMLYVCDRGNDRIQVFQKSGTFVKEKSVAPKTLGEGSVWDIAFSRDPQQKYLYVADGQNDRVRILDRATLEELTTFGDGGRMVSEFTGLQGVATDSKGNIYTTETYEGKRVQKFDFKGLAGVTQHDQGAVRPGSAK
jgi:DNA-binding beta-propeller fold protein YncE